jgi:ABC-2 type transport system ATP-binding protein
MIQLKDINKNFGSIHAVKNLTADIHDGEVFGVIGTNGAGKSTLLRMIAGVLKPDSGEIFIDGKPVYENPETKKLVCFLPDTTWFLPNSTPEQMAAYYKIYYPDFDTARFIDLVSKLGLDKSRKLRTFSKGMKRQTAVLLGICTGAKYLLCDEVFDGLDPAVRQAVKSLFAVEVMNRAFTPVIASHNLRELEDICDHVGLLHQGGMLFSENLEEVKLHVNKIQCVLTDPVKVEELLKELSVIKFEKRGSMIMIVARGTRLEILEAINSKQPVFSEVLPLSLEEIFISETEVAGYDIKDLLL